ncbi:hypothetical protein RRG08_002407 [Elysia crispata]|uniref:Uncharacterized protein n=1 Tax=Elysia crispata TaxID=231223 RepID=A0AAE0ZGM9_9GAST|nr:hypothetical protein RRG08_002407 [Elysia crispata]
MIGGFPEQRELRGIVTVGSGQAVTSLAPRIVCSAIYFGVPRHVRLSKHKSRSAADDRGSRRQPHKVVCDPSVGDRHSMDRVGPGLEAGPLRQT